MDMSLSELRELVMDREAWRTCDLWDRKESDMTEWLNWTEDVGMYFSLKPKSTPGPL